MELTPEQIDELMNEPSPLEGLVAAASYFLSLRNAKDVTDEEYEEAEERLEDALGIAERALR